MNDIATYIGEQLKAGERVYVINDVEQCAMCFDPRRPLKVVVKTRGGYVGREDPRDMFIYETTLAGAIASEEEFEAF